MPKSMQCNYKLNESLKVYSAFKQDFVILIVCQSNYSLNIQLCLTEIKVSVFKPEKKKSYSVKLFFLWKKKLLRAKTERKTS